jgi:isopropylmalate/homocitrate/citramalate synthase
MTKLIWYDDSPRDGEQQPGVFFDKYQKKELVPEIIDAGADSVILMPIVHPTEEELTKELCQEGYKDYISVTTMLSETQFKQAEYIGAVKIIPFFPVSDRFIKYTGFSRDDCLRIIENKMKTAYSMGFQQIDFAAVDATWADLKYVNKLVKVIEPYIKEGTFFVCDTVGCMTPEGYQIKISEIVKNAPDGVSIGVHCHNDMGQANDNTIAGVKAGATVIDATFGGLGDRAGNACIEEVLFTLKTEGIVLPRVKYEKLHELSKKVCSYGGEPGKPAKPAELYSQEAYTHVAGIHAWLELKSIQQGDSSPFPASSYGRENIIVFGYTSGKSNIRIHYGSRFTDEQCAYIRDRIKNLSIAQRKVFTKPEIDELMKKGIIKPYPEKKEVMPPQNKTEPIDYTKSI